MHMRWWMRSSFETTELIFAHELGHLMGAEHDALTASSTAGAIPGQSHGYFDQSPGSECISFITIMTGAQARTAEPGCDLPRVRPAYDAWPNTHNDTKHNGRPVGNASAKNRDSLALTVPFVSKFRCGLPSPVNVWMKDAWNDSGAEPDPGQAGTDMWKSPYIWVRNSAETVRRH